MRFKKTSLPSTEIPHSEPVDPHLKAIRIRELEEEFLKHSKRLRLIAKKAKRNRKVN